MSRRVVECWCCGQREPNGGRGLCPRCYHRWWKKGFTPPGPGLARQSRIAQAHEYSAIITSLPTHLAADRLNVTPSTVRRWRGLLRAA